MFYFSLSWQLHVHWIKFKSGETILEKAIFVKIYDFGKPV